MAKVLEGTEECYSAVHVSNYLYVATQRKDLPRCYGSSYYPIDRYDLLIARGIHRLLCWVPDIR